MHIEEIYVKKTKHLVIECKYKSLSLAKEHPSKIIANFQAFRKTYPEGKNYIVASDISTPYQRHFDGIDISYVNCQQLIEELR